MYVSDKKKLVTLNKNEKTNKLKIVAKLLNKLTNAQRLVRTQKNYFRWFYYC